MRVLIVEDEVHLADAISEGLEGEGFDVDAVHDGLDGLWRAREGSYDAIVLDVLLPGMNGYRVCKTLRDEGVWTPILILTAKDSEWDEAEALDTGADDFLSKPFSFVVLLARLRALFRRGAPPRPAVLELGPLRLDPAARRLTRDGQEFRNWECRDNSVEASRRGDGLMHRGRRDSLRGRLRDLHTQRHLQNHRRRRNHPRWRASQKQRRQ